MKNKSFYRVSYDDVTESWLLMSMKFNTNFIYFLYFYKN